MDQANQAAPEAAGLLRRAGLNAEGTALPNARPSLLKRYSIMAGGVALALTATLLGGHEVGALIDSEPSAYAQEEIELAPVATAIANHAIAIDATAVLELSNLLNQFMPFAIEHDIKFDYGLIEKLQYESARVGLSLPVTIEVPGATSFHTPFGVTTLFSPDAASDLADQLTGATQAWIDTLAQAPAITRVAPMANTVGDVAGDVAAFARFNSASTYAPASRSGARAGLPVNTAAVRNLADDFANWLTSETDAAAASQANFRARMVALSRAHGNGRLPREALCPIPFSPNFNMRCDVIDSLVELNNAFRAHFGRDVVVRSGYRANPGTSNHGWGLAVDFGGQLVNFGTSEFNWMSANARQFGWGHAFWAVPGGLNPQPWHWEAMDEIRELTGRWR